MEIPESDLKFMKEHGFHLEPEDSKTAENISKTVYFRFKAPYEKIDVMIVFQSSVGSYVILRYVAQSCASFYYETQSIGTEIISYEFKRPFSLGHLSNVFTDIENQVLSRLFFNEKTATSYRIASMMKAAINMNDESKMVQRQVNTYCI